MKSFLLALLLALGLVQTAKADIPPSIHVEGKDLVDSHGNKVVMHGVMDTPSQWFNDGRWGWGGYDASDAPSKCVTYFKEIFSAITDHDRGTYCTVFRLHLDPCWLGDNSVVASGFTQKNNKWIDPNGTEVDGEANIVHFSMARLKKFWSPVYWAITYEGLKKGLHIVIRPPGVCPGTIKVGDYYQKYLIDVWSYVASQTKMKQYAGQVSIELANEPVRITNADGSQTDNTMHDYFQPIVDAIRAQGFTGIIWVPGGIWQQDYRGYAKYPITGYNIGYAAHAYVGWYGGGDDNTGPNLLKHFLDGVPVVKTNPVIVTEIDWSPEKEGTGHYNESGNWVVANYGTWATGTTSGWGGAFKYAKDKLGNVSMTLTSTDDYIDMKTYHDTNGKTLRPAFAEAMKANGLDPYEACGQACVDWYAEYYKENRPKPDFAVLSTNLTNDQKKFVNPVIAADFPDPDVAKLGDTYYMLSTTFQFVPGATLLKSKDLVNWQYCCNPLEQLSTADSYNLIGGQYSYSKGMWAGAIEEHDGVLYILINGNDAGAFVLSTSNPEGSWDVKKLGRGYYDPGMIMEGDKIYIACGINHINICELDKNWNFKKETNVIQKEGTGLEGCHLYHIGDYYYIYATYGGWPTAQTIFRSKSVTGPYEEHDGMLFDKFISDAPNTVHQGALIHTDADEWWTMLMEDKGAIGRLPSLHPVAWADGWPTLGKKGVPQLNYTRPKMAAYPAITVPETNDNFRDFRLGKQWQWNHGAPSGKWSLLERPGYLRLRTSTVTKEMMLARGTLTQRIFAFHKLVSPYGLDNTKQSHGTIALDVRNMEDGDMAGIAALQDPYGMLAVTKDDNGVYRLVWKNGSHTGTDGYTPDSKTSAPIEVGADGLVYLRCVFDISDSKSTFFYSLDNKKWTAFGSATPHKFNLSVFTGVRWAIFNYATKDLGGYVDVDWFTTEDSFEESNFYPDTFENFDSEMLTVTKLALADGMEKTDVLIGDSRNVTIYATFADGHTEDVSIQTRYTSDNPAVVNVKGGKIEGLRDGEANITATYTDPLGNDHQVTFKVTASYFPFAKEFVKNIAYSNTYDETKRVFNLKANGIMGWSYAEPIDISGYKYLVIKLDTYQSSDASIRICTSNSTGDYYYKTTLGTSRNKKINLQSIKYTSTGKKGELLDLTNICKVVFVAGKDGTIDFADMYLTNNEDGSREDYTGIEVAEPVKKSAATDAIYNLAGQRVARPTQPGIYIMGGRKVVVK